MTNLKATKGPWSDDGSLDWVLDGIREALTKAGERGDV